MFTQLAVLWMAIIRLYEEAQRIERGEPHRHWLEGEFVGA